MKYEKYVYVDGQKVYVTDEVYKALKNQKNREEYLSRLDREYLDTNFIHLIGVENIADSNVDVEKIVYTNLLIEKLKTCMKNLSKEERYIIQKLYFEEQTLRAVAKSINVALSTLVERRNKVLKKLKELIGD